MECIAPRYLHSRDITVPCGSCAFCLATRRSDWVQRLMMEWRHSDGSRFITLTYANPHLTYRGGKAQLVKADLQKWFKRLRKSLSTQYGKAAPLVRYYAVGEYGSKTLRPHYHVILFGSIPENVVRSTWNLGTVHIGQLTWASCGYCTKYIINSKMLRGKESIDHGNAAKDIPPLGKMRNGYALPFQVMSRGRGKLKGIGSQYLTKAMIRWHKDDFKNYIQTDEGKRHLPRYYKEKIFNKRERWIISTRAMREAIESERKTLLRLWKKGKQKDAQAYMHKQKLELAKRIKDKSHQQKLVNDV